ncbi:fimbria/pilus outer membrane usher protein [Pseudoalteromonas fenneropenaei]|uniref:Fimbria/pilus outer membrane usher protein n=1 Tax=Pseudoalteromonas fenneropenaei TaxID=1737459 RepID=A0ABV7CEK1_9GAMM
MDFPVRINVAEVGQVAAAVEGFELHSIAADEFKHNLQSVLSDEVLTWLTNQGERAITPIEFAAHGINLVMQAQDLTIEMSLSEAAMATDRLSYGRTKDFELPTGEASWALLNNFNLNHERSANNTQHYSQFEWLINANMGGGDGLNMQSALFWENGSEQDNHFYRGDVTLFYDRPEQPLRFSFGDTQLNSTGHLSGVQLGGFAIEKAYARLQPQRRVSPSNSQQFVLPRPATLEIFINDFLLSRIRLQAGRYDLNDLPLTSGVNNIHIVATYANGETQEFHFTSHYNSRLLAQGLSDYALAIGYVSSLDNGNYHYDDELLVSGSYEYGLTDSLTIGINGAAHPFGHVVGAITTMNSPIGNVSLRYSQSKIAETTGSAYAIETEHSVFGNGNFGSPNLRFGYERKIDFTNTPWQPLIALSNNQRAYMDYSYIINSHFDFNLNASRLINNEHSVTKNLAAEFNFRYQGIRLRFGYNHSESDDLRLISDHQFILNFSWNGFNRKTNTRTRSEYDNRSKVASASFEKTNNNFVDDYGYELRAEKGSDYRQEQLKASYTGAFFRTDFNANNYSHHQQSAQSSASINLSTSIGIADGYVGMGANTTTPFAVITKHKTLKHNKVLVNVDRFGRAQTMPSERIGALTNLGSGYTYTQFNVDVPDAPLGYDWGPGTYLLAGGATTGHHIQIGSDLSFTLIGAVVDDKGIPFAMKRGRVIKLTGSDAKALSWPFFTNRTGRFVLEGISAGDYRIELDDYRGTFSVQDSEERFVKIGTVTLAPVTHSRAQAHDQ